VVVLVVAALLGEPALPRGAATRWGSAGAGALAALGGVLFLLSTQHGYLAVTGVIVSLYPAMTVLLAVLVLRERVHAVQVGGFVLCAAAVACIASG
jgi:drug/metabolite transporter (DMT)-like permease